MLLQVVESIGSSPGRVGFRMAVVLGEKGEKSEKEVLFGSIGGGIMEQKLVALAVTHLREGRGEAFFKRQVHRKDAVRAQSGMICSGEQTVFFYTFKATDLAVIEQIRACLTQNVQNNGHSIGTTEGVILLSASGIGCVSDIQNMSDLTIFKQLSNLENNLDEKFNDDFYDRVTYWQQGVYVEKLNVKNHLYIVGGGHCALALSRQMRLLTDFRIHLFDDRADLNTFLENDAAHEKMVVDYAKMADIIPESFMVYVVLMTVGYRSDEQILRGLLSKKLKYLGMLGSRSKVATMLKNLKNDGFEGDFLEKIHAPIGLDIKSQTPEEIAVSIAAEIIRVKNA
jgi:xanthine dehydrogenase accessory factor